MELGVIIVLIGLAGTAKAASDQDVQQWQAYKAGYRKSYTGNHDSQRMAIFLQKKQQIDDHNNAYTLGQTTYTMAVNNFTDWSTDEIAQLTTALVTPNASSPSTAAIYDPFLSLAALPSSFPSSLDWRAYGAVTAVKNQGSCGACWAFSAAAALESHYFFKTGQLISLSEQNLIDCTGPYGNKGCLGGYMTSCFQYIKDNNGVDTEAAYPFEGAPTVCRYLSSNVGATDTGYVQLSPGSEDALVVALVYYGPIAVGLDASPNFLLYSSGVFYDASCSSTALNHAAVVVGYDQDANGNEYYIVKNSWGTGWGQQGYVYMSRNRDNNCGIATLASYPTV